MLICGWWSSNAQSVVVPHLLNPGITKSSFIWILLVDWIIGKVVAFQHSKHLAHWSPAMFLGWPVLAVVLSDCEHLAFTIGGIRTKGFRQSVNLRSANQSFGFPFRTARAFSVCPASASAKNWVWRWNRSLLQSRPLGQLRLIVIFYESNLPWSP